MTPAETNQAPERSALVLLTLILVAAVANLNLAVANVALPDIGKALDASQTGLNLIAVGLTSDEARGCALVYAQSEVAEDVPVPVDETATDGWEAYWKDVDVRRRRGSSWAADTIPPVAA